MHWVKKVSSFWIQLQLSAWKGCDGEYRGKSRQSRPVCRAPSMTTATALIAPFSTWTAWRERAVCCLTALTLLVWIRPQFCQFGASLPADAPILAKSQHCFGSVTLCDGGKNSPSLPRACCSLSRMICYHDVTSLASGKIKQVTITYFVLYPNLHFLLPGIDASKNVTPIPPDENYTIF